MENVPLIKNVLILDVEGNRVAVKYYLDDDWPTDADKEAFEKAVFNKTQNTNEEITVFEKYVVVHRFIQDLHYFVIGGKEGNELQLSFVLQNFYNLLCLLLGNNIDKKVALENLDLVHSCLDDVHYRLILETDDNVIVGKEGSSNSIESGSSSSGMLYVPSLKTVLILDSVGNRVAGKYYLDNEWPTDADKEAFEKTMLNKIINTNDAAPTQEGKIIRFENYMFIYKSVQDVYFFVIGDKDEKKRDLSSLFHSFIDAVDFHLSNNVNKEEVLENVNIVHEILDKIVNCGCPYGGSDDDDDETDNVIACKEASNSIESRPSLSNQTSSQAFGTAGEQLADTIQK